MPLSGSECDGLHFAHASTVGAMMVSRGFAFLATVFPDENEIQEE